MKAKNIKWDTDCKEDAERLPLEIMIPDNIWNQILGSCTQDTYESRIEAISDFLTEKTGFCHEGFTLEIERKDAIRYALNAGTGITYDPEEGETIQEEKDAPEKTRYVENDTIEFWLGDGSGDTPEAYAIIATMDLIDYDEWRAVCRAVKKEIHAADGMEIARILWENYNASPLDAPNTSCEAKTFGEMFGIPEMTTEDEADIADILAEYKEIE